MSIAMKTVLQVGPVHPSFDARLSATYDVVQLWRPEGRARLDAIAPAIEVVATSAFNGCDAAVMAKLPRLKAISSFGIGWDAIDVAAARARDIQISVTPGVLDDCVADLAFALLLDVMRRTSAADRFTRAGGWEKGRFPLATKVSGKRLGIVGLGRIGRVVARRAAGFDMEVAYNNRHAIADTPFPWYPTAVSLAEWADALVILCPGGPATRNLISTEVLAALGPKGFLVNVSRGSVVDEAALIAALEAGTIAGAGLDVFADEPRVPAALTGRDDVVLTPHVASGTVETREAMADLTLANIESFFATGRVKTPIPG